MSSAGGEFVNILKQTVVETKSLIHRTALALDIFRDKATKAFERF